MLPSWEFGILFLALPHSSGHLPFLVLVSIPPRWGIMTLELLSTADNWSFCLGVWSQRFSSSVAHWTHGKGELKAPMPGPLPEGLGYGLAMGFLEPPPPPDSRV